MSVSSPQPSDTVLSPEDKKRLIDRLARVEGQLRGVQKMIAQDKECELIAQQISAARGALEKAFSDQIGCAIGRCIYRVICLSNRYHAASDGQLGAGIRGHIRLQELDIVPDIDIQLVIFDLNIQLFIRTDDFFYLLFFDADYIIMLPYL